MKMKTSTGWTTVYLIQYHTSYYIVVVFLYNINVQYCIIVLYDNIEINVTKMT